MSSGVIPDRPLPARLSQVLVAYTIEFDNLFEKAVADAGFPGIGLSQVVWASLFRFIPAGGVAVEALGAAAFGGATERILATLGCLERWRFVEFLENDGARPAAATRDARSGRRVRVGYGSARGIRKTWIVKPTGKGAAALGAWPRLYPLLDQRWRQRFGARAVDGLCTALQTIADHLMVDVPDGVPQEWEPFPLPSRTPQPAGPLSIPALLARALNAFAGEYASIAPVTLGLASNQLRVITTTGIRVSDLPRLTGGSPETSAIGWRLKRYVSVGAAAGSRGQVARLTAAGLDIQRAHPGLVALIETRWRDTFGTATLDALDAALDALFEPGPDGSPQIAAGLVPPAGVRRAGEPATTLGPVAMTAVERKRTRDMAAQTTAFVADPASALPHYPMWDMNRGFGA